MSKKKNKKIKEKVQEIELSGVRVSDLIRPKFVKELNKKFDSKPFFIAIDINRENIITVGHDSPKEENEKNLSVKCRFSSNGESHIEEFIKILKKVVS